MSDQNDRPKPNSPDPSLFLTTEHFALQGARSSTVSESNGRSSLFVTTLSSSLVALGFIAQTSKLGEAFVIFAFVLLPTLLFLGLVTFYRLLQSAVEDMICARAINRIRHYYLEQSPEVAQYFLMSDHDDNAGMLRNMGVDSSPWQMFVTNAGSVSVINGVLGAAFFGLVARLGLGWGVVSSVVVGASVFVTLIGLQTVYQVQRWTRVERQLPVLFPSNDESESQPS